MQLENYSNAPLSIAEVKAQEERSSAPWTPRDALINVLRAIDKGEIDPISVVIIYDTMARSPGSKGETYYVAAVRGFHKALGLVYRAAWLMQQH